MMEADELQKEEEKNMDWVLSQGANFFQRCLLACSSPKLLVCDMDGTLLGEPFHFSSKQPAPFRPYIKEFFAEVERFGFDCAIWSAASDIHVYNAVRALDIHLGRKQSAHFLFVWHKEHCLMNRRSNTILKPLERIYKMWPQFNATSTIILDNTPTTYECNPENGFPISTYVTKSTPYPEDHLKQILNRLEVLSKWTDVRLLLKKWYSHPKPVIDSV